MLPLLTMLTMLIMLTMLPILAIIFTLWSYLKQCRALFLKKQQLIDKLISDMGSASNNKHPEIIPVAPNPLEV